MKRRDVRLAALAITVLAVALGGASLFVDFNRAAPGKANAEFHARFQQAAIMLHAKQYDHAVTALHRLLQIAPEVPEVHVNMGYAMLGLERYKEARDFFEGATALRRDQVNAYYGLALALEALGDKRAALGAMRTYVHRSPPDDPHVRKAMSAIWEWESSLK